MILDVCCGSQMFYFDKNRDDLITMDIRKENFEIHGKKVNVNPQIIGDFTNIPFKNETFHHISRFLLRNSRDDRRRNSVHYRQFYLPGKSRRNTPHLCRARRKGCQ